MIYTVIRLMIRKGLKMTVVNGNEITVKHIEIGDFIEVPAWNIYGCVTDKEIPYMGTEDAQRVFVNTDPNDSKIGSWFNLEPEGFNFI